METNEWDIGTNCHSRLGDNDVIGHISPLDFDNFVFFLLRKSCYLSGLFPFLLLLAFDRFWIDSWNV